MIYFAVGIIQTKTDEWLDIELFVKYAACILSRKSRVCINFSMLHFHEIFTKVSNLIFEYFCAIELILLIIFRKSQIVSFVLFCFV